jgi:Peptidase family M23
MAFLTASCAESEKMAWPSAPPPDASERPPAKIKQDRPAKLLWPVSCPTREVLSATAVRFRCTLGNQEVRATAAGLIHIEDDKVVAIAHGDGRTSRYAHLDHLLVKDGQFVQDEQTIGYLAGPVEMAWLRLTVSRGTRLVDPVNELEDQPRGDFVKIP